MEKQLNFKQEFVKIAVPIALQSLLQSSFSMVDQIMVGQLGEVSIAGIGLAGRFASLYSVVLTAIATVAGIMLAQYFGKEDEKEIARSFYLNLCLAIGLSLCFFGLCIFLPKPIMNLYTTDTSTRDAAAVYLSTIALGFFARPFSSLYATLLRCKGKADIPLYATIFNAGFDTVLSYVLIFGKFGFPEMGVAGAALATVIAQYAECIVIVFLYYRLQGKEGKKMPFTIAMSRDGWFQYSKILAPILICEFFWSLGENVYGAIYGHIGTKSCAAMTLISPMVMLFMGLMSGVSSAAGILVGKRLGAKECDLAYKEAKKMMWYGIAGSAVLSVSLILFGKYYVGIFQVDEEVRSIAYGLLVMFAIVAPVKVQNMIVGGGIIRSGGATKYVMYIDLIGTWVFGVPLGLLSAFVWNLPITWVYFILSMEECVRLVIALFVYRSKKWMQEL